MRRATSARPSRLRTRAAIARLELVRESASIVGGRDGDDRLALARRSPSSSLSIGSTNFVDAVAQQLGGDVVEVDARLGQRAQVGLGVDLGGRRRSTFAWSAAASSVAIGIVLTVSGPTSPSTYIVSG